MFDRRHARFLAIIACAALATLVPVVFAAAPPEWPRFRGPEANPISRVPLADTWSRTQNVEWKTSIPGRGWSSPIVAGTRVFVTAATTDGPSKKPQIGTQYSNEYIAELQKQGLSEADIEAKVIERDFELPKEVMLHYYLYCLDLKTGKLNWTREYYAGHPPVGRHRKGSFASETPVTDGSHVFVYSMSLGLWAFDMKGRQVWHTPLEPDPVYGDFGTGASPILAGDSLIIVSDNEKQQFIAAFDKKTGRQVWRTNRDLKAAGRRTAWSTPYLWTTPGRTEVVTTGPGFSISYDLTGRELWRMGGAGGGPISSPSAAGGLLYLNGGSGGVFAAIRPGATGVLPIPKDKTPNAFVAWALERAGTGAPTHLTYDGAVYSLNDTGILSRYDAATGTLAYRARIEGGTAFTSSPWASDGKVFCLNEEGRTFVVAAGPEYKLLRVNDLDEFTLATPALVGDRLILRTESQLYSIRQRK